MANRAYEGRGEPYDSLGGEGAGLAPVFRRRIFWGALFAGVVLTLAIQLLLGMLGLGVGFSTISPAQGPNGLPNATNFEIGAALWWTISYLIALFAGGYTAARLAGVPTNWDGVLHGLLTWAFVLLVSFWLMTTAVGALIGGAFNTVSSAVSSLGSAATETVKATAPQLMQATGLSPDVLNQRATELLGGPGGGDVKTMSRDTAAKEIGADLLTVLQGGDLAQQARQRIVQIMAAQLGISEQEANSRLDQMIARLQKTKEQVVGEAKQAADQAASGLSKISFVGFVSLLLGACAGALGGRAGARSKTDEEPRITKTTTTTKPTSGIVS